MCRRDLFISFRIKLMENSVLSLSYVEVTTSFFIDFVSLIRTTVLVDMFVSSWNNNIVLWLQFWINFSWRNCGVILEFTVSWVWCVEKLPFVCFENVPLTFSTLFFPIRSWFQGIKSLGLIYHKRFLSTTGVISYMIITNCTQLLYL